MPIPKQPNGLHAGSGTNNGHTLSDSNELPGNTLGLHLRVTTAGYLSLVDESGAQMDLPFDEGTHFFECARLKYARDTDTTLTLDPADTVFPIGEKVRP